MKSLNYNFQPFKEFLEYFKQHDQKETFEFLKQNAQKFDILEFLYFFSSLNGRFQQYALQSENLEELKRDSIDSESYSRAFLMYHEYIEYEKLYDFRLFDVFNNLIEDENYIGIEKLFLKSPRAKIEYSKNKELLLTSGFPFQEELVHCYDSDREEFLYIQKLQSYFKTDSKSLVERVKNDKVLKDFFTKYSVVERDFGLEFLEAYFGDNTKQPRVCPSARKL